MYALCSIRDLTERSSPGAASAAWVGVAVPATATHRTPFQGSSPCSEISSGKIQRFPASAAASRVARPTARWSGVFQ